MLKLQVCSDSSFQYDGVAEKTHEHTNEVRTTLAAAHSAALSAFDPTAPLDLSLIVTPALINVLAV